MNLGIWKELELPLTAALLHFVEVSTNRAGWTTWAYAANLEHKPALTVPADSAGVVWLDERRFTEGRPRLLSGHLGIVRRALVGMK